MTKIDSAIFDFISRLGSIQLTPQEDKPELKGNDPVVQLGEVKNFGVEQVNPSDGSIVSKYVDVNGRLTGLNEEDFLQLRSLVSEYLNQEPFSSLVDAEFLVNESFKWLIDVFKNKQAASNLTDHLLNVLSDSPTDHHFYFRIEPLEMEENLVIGDVEFIFFSDERIKQLYEEYTRYHPNTTFKRFKEVCDKNFGRINVFVRAKGVFSRAETEAMRKAELSVDVLKCCCIGDAMQFKVQVFDLDYRLQRRTPSFYLTHTHNDVANLSTQIRNEGGVVPIRLTKEKLQNLQSKGLSTLAAFIKLQKKGDELYDQIIGLIHQLGSIISTSDSYEKVVKAVSLLESFLISKNATGKAFGLSKVKAAIPKLGINQHEQELLLKYLPVVYKIRDQYLHNYRKLPLNIEQLMFFLNFERVFIVKMIDFNRSMSTIKEVHDCLGITNK